jgi:predicted  nucleic acid-binding Zn-ribbon protein
LSHLAPLLDLQDLDLSRDRLAAERLNLPERAALLRLEADAIPIDAAYVELLARREALRLAEKTLSVEVDALAARAKETEHTLYSGSVRNSKELSGLQAEMQGLRARQGDLETRELGLLEELEGVEGEIAANREARERVLAESRRIEASLQIAEGRIDAELESLLAARANGLPGISAELLAAYEKLRKRERLAGRVVARILEGGCAGCRMRLPIHEHNLMQARPENALLICPHCGRILVRSAPVPAA